MTLVMMRCPDSDECRCFQRQKNTSKLVSQGFPTHGSSCSSTKTGKDPGGETGDGGLTRRWAVSGDASTFLATGHALKKQKEQSPTVTVAGSHKLLSI